jgi:isoprenylcysteine carboxyl methyltransferase (ICMT) family protein YpbQ
MNETCYGESYSLHRQITNITSFIILFLFNFIFVLLPFLLSCVQNFKNRNKTRILIILNQLLIQLGKFKFISHSSDSHFGFIFGFRFISPK